MRLIIGNPLYAITMIRYDITAGLCPVSCS